MRTVIQLAAVLLASSSAAAAAGGSLRGDSAPEASRRSARLQEEQCGVTGGCATFNACTKVGTTNEAECEPPAAYVCEHQLPGLSVCESPPVSAMLPCWMASLDGALGLNEISMPGTHNTMAKGDSACFQQGRANLVHTQTWSLRTMLDAGVRVIDIRLRHVDDSFTLEHGIVGLPYTFDEDVRDVLADFLLENPTEAVVMLSQVNDLGPNTRSPEETLQVSMNANPGLWITGTSIPTLAEARGKVVFARDMQVQEQNEYDLTFADLSNKKNLIRQFFLEDGGTPVANTFRINYFSGASLLLYPLTVAAGVRDIFQGTNEVLFEFSGGFLGITLFDFVGEDAIAHVVSQQGPTAPSWNPPSG